MDGRENKTAFEIIKKKKNTDLFVTFIFFIIFIG